MTEDLFLEAVLNLLFLSNCMFSNLQSDRLTWSGWMKELERPEFIEL